MNILDGFKTLYTAGGGQENLDELQGNKDQNMHSVIYGDGLYTTLPSNIENDVLSIAKGGGSGKNVLTLYPTEHAESDPMFPDWIPNDEYVAYGLSLILEGTPLTIEQLGDVFRNNILCLDVSNPGDEKVIYPVSYRYYIGNSLAYALLDFIVDEGDNSVMFMSAGGCFTAK